MNQAKRPWWLLLNKSHQLIVTLNESTHPGERVFTIKGQPMVQGLTWLTCGPVSALVVIALLVGLAIAFQVRDRGVLVQALFIMAFLGLPAVAWGITVIAANRMSAKYVEAIKQAETQLCVISLNQSEGILTCQPAGSPTKHRLAYPTIKQVRVTPAPGARDSKSMVLMLDTVDGPMMLLDEPLGTQAQKVDLMHEIQMSLENFEANKNPSG